MPRAKVKLEWIENDSARRRTFKRRSEGLVKKVRELTTLCDVPACVIIYGQGSSDPIVWPSRPEAEELLERYHSLPIYERSKKTFDQESYLSEEVAKMRVKYTRVLQENTRMEISNLIHQITNGKPINELELNEIFTLRNFIEEKMQVIRNQIGFFEHTGPKFGLPHFPGNDTAGSSSFMVPNMMSFNGHIENSAFGEINGNINNGITNTDAQMGYFGDLPQYYGNNNAGSSNMEVAYARNGIGWSSVHPGLFGPTNSN